MRHSQVVCKMNVAIQFSWIYVWLLPVNSLSKLILTSKPTAPTAHLTIELTKHSWKMCTYPSALCKHIVFPGSLFKHWKWYKDFTLSRILWIVCTIRCLFQNGHLLYNDFWWLLDNGKPYVCPKCTTGKCVALTCVNRQSLLPGRVALLYFLLPCQLAEL